MIFFYHKRFFVLSILLFLLISMIFANNEQNFLTNNVAPLLLESIQIKKSNVPVFFENKNGKIINLKKFFSVNEAAVNGIVYPTKLSDVSFACFKFSNQKLFSNNQLEVNLEFNGELPYSVNACLFYDENITLSFDEKDNVCVYNLTMTQYGLKLRFPLLKKENKDPVGVILWFDWNSKDKNNQIKDESVKQDIFYEKEALVQSDVFNPTYVKVKSFSLTEKLYGWSLPFLLGQTESSFYGFETFGKKYTEIPSCFDLTEINKLYKILNDDKKKIKEVKTNENILDNVFIQFGIAPSGFKMLYDNKYGVLPEVVFENTDNKITFYPYHKSYTTKIPLSCFEKKVSKITLNDVGNYLYEVLIQSKNNMIEDGLSNKKLNDFLPVVLDPGLILDYPQKNWRNENYEVFSWDRFPSVLIFDTVNYSFQSKMFDRIALFVEKAEYSGKILPENEMKNKIGFLAHDYNSESLASFFSEASKQKIKLLTEEEQLKEILLSEKIITKNDDNTFCQGEGAVISISRESELYRRRLFLVHECCHGLFFFDEDFRNLVAELYDNTAENLKDFLKEYYKISENLKYDTNNLYLMQNEFMAYILQLSLDRTLEHFSGYIASRMQENTELLPLVEYIKNDGKEDLAIANKKLSDYLYTRWGLEAGRINLLIRNMIEKSNQ